MLERLGHDNLKDLIKTWLYLVVQIPRPIDRSPKPPCSPAHSQQGSLELQTLTLISRKESSIYIYGCIVYAVGSKTGSGLFVTGSFDGHVKICTSC
jgi:hypothetical protein